MVLIDVKDKENPVLLEGFYLMQMHATPGEGLDSQYNIEFMTFLSDSTIMVITSS